jgi:hypothetical protein
VSLHGQTLKHLIRRIQLNARRFILRFNSANGFLR